MPGRKDCVTLKVFGKKTKVQKKMILYTIKEAYIMFKEEYKNNDVSLSKFAELRPKHVVLPGTAGTHTVCVCIYHQNPKLMISCSHISSHKIFRRIAGLGDGNEYEGQITYHHLLAALMCNPPNISCWLGKCTECMSTEGLHDTLEGVFDELGVQDIIYKQWESTDRAYMVTRTENVCDFLNELLDKLDVLKKHQFINDQQTKYFYEVKENLPEGKVLCVGDFSQNFSFVYQDAIQGVHWSNTSCTLHPWLCYYRGVEGKVCD